MHITWQKPKREDLLLAFAYAIAGASTGLVLRSLIGGSFANVVGLAAVGLATGLLSKKEVRFDREGWRNVGGAVARIALVYAAATALATPIFG